MGGVISIFNFKDYMYEDILRDGRFNGRGFNGNVALNDPNVSIYLDGIIDLNQ